MARIRPTNINLVKKLTGLNKSYFTVGDLEKVLGLERKSLLVALSRLVKAGVLIRIKRNMYTVFTGNYDLERIVNERYHPSYVSFETALSHYGILSQMPFTITLATLRPSRKMRVGNSEVEYSHLKEDLFFGYKIENGKYIAEPEKALLDQLYMASRGRRVINIEELDLRDIDREKLNEYAKKFPKYTYELLRKVKRYVGSTPITNENKDRIVWSKGI